MAVIDVRREVVTVLPPVKRDRFGDPVPGAGEPYAVDEVLVSPGPADESVARARDGATVEYTLYRRGPFPVTRFDRVVVRGETFEVDGEPRVWAGAGVVVELRRGEG